MLEMLIPVIVLRAVRLGIVHLEITCVILMDYYQINKVVLKSDELFHQ